MKKIAGIILGLGLACAANAAVITKVGDGTNYDVTGGEANDYFSTGVAKTFDVGATDNAYGTAGYYVYGNDPATAFESTPSFITDISTGSDFLALTPHDLYALIDNPSGGIVPSAANFTKGATVLSTKLAAGNWSEVLKFTVDTSVTSFRLGVMGLDTGNWSPTGIRVSSGAVIDTVTGLENLDNTAGIAFFDITTDGTASTFSIEAQQRTGTGQGTSLTGVTFDVIPEPATLGLVAAFGTAIMFIRRRIMM